MGGARFELAGLVAAEGGLEIGQAGRVGGGGVGALLDGIPHPHRVTGAGQRLVQAGALADRDVGADGQPGRVTLDGGEVDELPGP